MPACVAPLCRRQRACCSRPPNRSARARDRCGTPEGHQHQGSAVGERTGEDPVSPGIVGDDGGRARVERDQTEGRGVPLNRRTGTSGVRRRGRPPSGARSHRARSWLCLRSRGRRRRSHVHAPPDRQSTPVTVRRSAACVPMRSSPPCAQAASARATVSRSRGRTDTSNNRTSTIAGDGRARVVLGVQDQLEGRDHRPISHEPVPGRANHILARQDDELDLIGSEGSCRRLRPGRQGRPERHDVHAEIGDVEVKDAIVSEAAVVPGASPGA